MRQKRCFSWDKARVRQSSPKVAQGRQLVQPQDWSWMPWWIVLSCRYVAQWTNRWSWRTWQLKSHRHRSKTSSAGTQLDLEYSFSQLLDHPSASEQLPKPGLMCSTSNNRKSQKHPRCPVPQPNKIPKAKTPPWKPSSSRTSFLLAPTISTLSRTVNSSA